MSFHRKKMHNSGHRILVCILCLLALCAWAQTIRRGAPSMPQALKDNPDKVYLLYSDELTLNESRPDYQVLRGNVRFRKDSMYMYCDSAYFYSKSNSLDAFGNVRMEQGDTLFVFADVLYYDGPAQLARLRYNVRMENRDVTLFTDSLNYDLVPNIGYYFEGGKIVDSQNELSSVYGQYSPDTKEAVFNYDVVLVNEQYTLYSDTLEYSTMTKIADIVGPSKIVSDSNIIYSSKGWYDTENNKALLLDRSVVVGKTQQLTGDSLFYNREKGFGEVFGNIQLTDSARKVIMEGQYGFYNEKNEFAFATDSARLLEFSRGDTLFLHADTLQSMLVLPDSSRILKAFHEVRFFRVDVQGVCDSLEYLTADSTLYMFRDPIIWNGSYQIFGDTIRVHMNDSTVEWVHIPQFAFAAQHKDSVYFDQLAGKDLKAFFREGELYKIDVSGNVQTIFYPMERDSTYTGLNNAESSFLTMLLKDQKMDKLTMWPEVKGSMTPPQLIKRSQLFLPDYRWYEPIRPKDKWDIYRKIEKKVEDVPKKQKHRFGEQ
ncbi:hypothetical protein OCV73_03235 [Barnesiella propionica]|uniref:OstA-like protein n=1 Tax=Barnesiella propionica TaxID=2981781 RepID=UPI0021D26C51|nr:OstA-like protein [Barnesiella propionica]MCU6767962.1 hypothetical protein [Barnesiella propionica]